MGVIIIIIVVIVLVPGGNKVKSYFVGFAQNKIILIDILLIFNILDPIKLNHKCDFRFPFVEINFPPQLILKMWLVISDDFVNRDFLYLLCNDK